jgi:23S rRNA pseudouridine955/2504/2580 synthase
VFYRRQTWSAAVPPLSLLEAELHTGRTHQIRVHLTHLGYPLAGDDKYGDFAWNRLLAREGLKRMFLHAWRLVLMHPLESRVLALEAALPEDLAGFVAGLNRTDPGDA